MSFSRLSLRPIIAASGSRKFATSAVAFKHKLPDLPYDYAALEPTISATIMEVRIIVCYVSERKREKRKEKILTCNDSFTTQSTTKHTSTHSTKPKKNTPPRCTPATSPHRSRCSPR